MPFKPAEKIKSLLRAALIGPSGSGKTYTALEMAKVLAPSGRVALIDTEHGSASKYADLFKFDVLELEDFAAKNYIVAIAEAEKAGYELLIIDSLSHAWAGKGGILEFVDTETAKSKSGNAFTTGWRKATPEHNKLVEAILAARLHVIATMRSKVKYVLEDDGRGHQAPKKVGMEPVQREGMEYEFDLVADMNMDNLLIIGKTRCPALSGKAFEKPTSEPALTLKGWLENGAPAPPATEKKPEAKAGAQAGSQAGTQAAAKALTPDERNVIYEKIAVGFRDLVLSTVKSGEIHDWTDERIAQAAHYFCKAIYGVDTLGSVPDNRLLILALAVTKEGPKSQQDKILATVKTWSDANPPTPEPDPLDEGLEPEKQKGVSAKWEELRLNCSESIYKKITKHADKYLNDETKLNDYLDAAILGEKGQAEAEGKAWK